MPDPNRKRRGWAKAPRRSRPGAFARFQPFGWIFASFSPHRLQSGFSCVRLHLHRQHVPHRVRRRFYACCGMPVEAAAQPRRSATVVHYDLSERPFTIGEGGTWMGDTKERILLTALRLFAGVLRGEYRLLRKERLRARKRVQHPLPRSALGRGRFRSSSWLQISDVHCLQPLLRTAPETRPSCGCRFADRYGWRAPARCENTRNSPQAHRCSLRNQGNVSL